MPHINPNRAAFFLVLIIALFLGLALSNFTAADWVPYVLLGMGCLSIGLLLTLLFVKKAGITFSWPALLALGVVATLMFTALFKQVFADPVPPEAKAMVEALEDYHGTHNIYPKSLSDLSLEEKIPTGLQYQTRSNGEVFDLLYKPADGTSHRYRSSTERWSILE